MNAADLTQLDYFTDHSLLVNPYEYFRQMHANGPITPMAGDDTSLLVTGFDEAVEILRNNKDFSSVISAIGAGKPLSFTPEGSDISDQIEAFRPELGMLNLLVTYDDKLHSDARFIASKLFTPSRLKATHSFMVEFADQLIKDALAKGTCELVSDIATPFVTLVIADLLGVPPEDRDKFRKVLDDAPSHGNLDDQAGSEMNSPLAFMAMFFMEYIQDRRQNPREDMLTHLAQATYPDGSLPEVIEMVKLCGFLFGAGQDTSAKLLSNSIRYIVDIPGMQDQLRSDYSLIPKLLEEVLRLEGSTKCTFRLARRDTKVGDRLIPAGTRLTLSLAAANRDPRRWPNPDEFQLDRTKIKEHLSFSRGVHTCAGAPLARIEVQTMLERLFDKTSYINLNEAKHGKPGDRQLTYDPSFITRGLTELYVDLKG